MMSWERPAPGGESALGRFFFMRENDGMTTETDGDRKRTREMRVPDSQNMWKTAGNTANMKKKDG